MKAVILTAGDPDALTGGSLYHRRIADRAPTDMRIEIRSLDRSDEVRHLEGDADVVVVDSIVASRVRPGVAHRPLVASVHQVPGGLTGSRLGRRIRADRDLRCYRTAHAVVVPSSFLADVLVRHGVAAERIRIVPPGRDLAVGCWAPSRAASPSPRGGVSFACVANLSAHKRPLELLEAFGSLGVDDATLTIVGGAADARLAERVRRRLRRPDLAGRAAWTGPLPPQGVARILSTADAFVLPAIGEAYGMAVAEALAAGLPAIVARSGNLPALVRDGVDGIVIPADDVRALGNAMRTLAREPALVRAMSAAARSGASRFPTWDEASRRFGDVLSEAQGPLTSRDAARSPSR